MKTPKGLPRTEARGSFQLQFFVFAVLHLLDLAGFDGSGNLTPNRPETFPDIFRHRLHIVGLEVAGQCRQDGFPCGGGVGVGHGDALRSLAVKNVDNVVVVGRDDADDLHRHIEVRIRAFHGFLDRSGVHQPQGRQHHRDAEETPGKAVRAGGVAVAIEFLHTVLLSCEEFVELARLREREPEDDLWFLLEQFGEGREPGSEGVEGFLQGFVASIGVESVEPFGRGVDAEEHEAGQQSVFRISYQRFHLLRRA